MIELVFLIKKMSKTFKSIQQNWQCKLTYFEAHHLGIHPFERAMLVLWQYHSFAIQSSLPITMYTMQSHPQLNPGTFFGILFYILNGIFHKLKIEVLKTQFPSRFSSIFLSLCINYIKSISHCNID